MDSTPSSAIEVGIIGMGDMGKLYARTFAANGWTVNVCDQPSNYDRLVADLQGLPRLNVFRDGFAVSRRSDYILYSVETAAIESVLAQYGPCKTSACVLQITSNPGGTATKMGAIVGGQVGVI
jgi:prephenate dehydrogenase (NADP+)